MPLPCRHLLFFFNFGDDGGRKGGMEGVKGINDTTVDF